MSSKVTKVRPDLERLVNEIKRVVYEQKGEISVTEAIGAIELAKLEILKEQR
jgi:ribosomal protein S6